MDQCLAIDFAIKEMFITSMNKDRLIIPRFVYEEQKIPIRMKNKLHD
jgi:hypothetical protein